jgi:hypothetical protein
MDALIHFSYIPRKGVIAMPVAKKKAGAKKSAKKSTAKKASKKK